jgi:hypothetical protein
VLYNSINMALPAVATAHCKAATAHGFRLQHAKLPAGPRDSSTCWMASMLRALLTPGVGMGAFAVGTSRRMRSAVRPNSTVRMSLNQRPQHSCSRPLAAAGRTHETLGVKTHDDAVRMYNAGSGCREGVDPRSAASGCRAGTSATQHSQQCSAGAGGETGAHKD